MSAPNLLCFPTLTAAGSLQMAIDEWMLHAAADGLASVRFYCWKEATLSLGYFQKAEDRLTDPLLQALPMVRRSSGGGAIVHHREITYALGLPPGSPWQNKESVVCKMHHTIIEVLLRHSIQARAVLCGEEKKLGPFLCFEHHTAGDVLLGEHKIVGSAQRRLRGAILQHGSILLAQSPHTPTLPGIQELASSAIPENLAEQILDQWQKHTSWNITPNDWQDSEWKTIQEIQAEKYARADWNCKR